MSTGTENTEKMALQASEPELLPPPRETMSLQQKLVELRKAVPHISKEKRSQYVDYKFAKIDDVWEAITPVMNELGVNFEVVRETNSSIETMTAKTKQGERLMFTYRADLTVQWINADDPEDSITVELHAIAWNDDPAKAKGSAWTYALKYYLFEKFSIDMGEDDPDNNNFATDGRTGGRSTPNGQGKGNTPPPQQNAPTGQIVASHGGSTGGSSGGPYRLSEKQLDRLYKKAEAAGMTKEAAQKRIKDKYNKDDPGTLTRAEYDEICDALDTAVPSRK